MTGDVRSQAADDARREAIRERPAGWGGPCGPPAGAGTTGDIEDAHAALDRIGASRSRGVVALSLAQRVIACAARVEELEASETRLREVCQRIRAGWLPHRLSTDGSWWWGTPSPAGGFGLWSTGQVPSMNLVERMADDEVAAWIATLHPMAPEAAGASTEGTTERVVADSAEHKIVDLMAALEESVLAARAARERRSEDAFGGASTEGDDFYRGGRNMSAFDGPNPRSVPEKWGSIVTAEEAEVRATATALTVNGYERLMELVRPEDRREALACLGGVVRAVARDLAKHWEALNDSSAGGASTEGSEG